MTEEVQLICQIPKNWKQKIERLASERKKQPNHIISEAIAQYLGEDIQTTDNRLLALETELTKLRIEIAGLNTTVQYLQRQGMVAPTLINPLQRDVRVIDDDEDFLEDEPDEILYDFLPPEER